MATVMRLIGSRAAILAGAMVLTVTLDVGRLRSAPELRPDYQARAHAIKGARIIIGDGTTVDPGTVVVRDGLIAAVGPAEKVAVPYDAETIDGAGLVVYPGFLDLYTTLGVPAGVPRSRTGPGRAVRYGDFALPRTPIDNRHGLTPEFEVAAVLELPEAASADRRRAGITDLVAAPGGAIVTGQSALVSLGDLPRREAIVQAPVALHVALRTPFEPQAQGTPGPSPPGTRRRGGGGAGGPAYPASLMGVVAHLRQAMLDADYERRLQAAAREPGHAPPPYDPALKALAAARSGQIPVWWEANTRDEILRALDLAEEFGTSVAIVGGREAAKVVDRLKARKVPVVLRLDFPDEPAVPSEAEYRNRSDLDRDPPRRVLVHRRELWKQHVATAKVLSDAGVPFAFSTEGLGRADQFLAQVRKLIAAGLPPEAALAALTRQAATLAGAGDRLGTIAPGKLGHLTVLSAPFSRDAAKVRYILVDGLKFEVEKPPAGRRAPAEAKEKEKKAEPKTEPSAAKAKAEPKPEKADRPTAASKGESSPPRSRETSKSEGPRPKGREEPKPDESRSQPKGEAKAETKADARKTEKAASAPAEPKGTEARKTERAASAPAEPKGAAARETPPSRRSEKPSAETEPSTKGATTTRKAADAPPANAPPAPAGATPASNATPAPAPPAAQIPRPTIEDQPPSTPFIDLASELEADRKPTLHTGGNLLIKDATILTVTHGTIPKGSILIRNGTIAAVGAELEIPKGITVLEAAGMVAMPGIIDSHSHMAIQGGVNEVSLSIVPEVRVRDVVTGDDPTIYRALAGGVTAARLLHGSANTIGGQDAVIKLRAGQAGRDLLIADADQGVKFALGENVTRVRGRFPNTRMGVEATIERAFDEAAAYRDAWQAYRAARSEGKDPSPPRRDLRLEALAGILDGTLKIHCHCYRSDEILMLLRVAARHGVRVRSLQHALEGYKVAPEIAAHGASASTFADWWAYKLEAFDAIPFNTALLTQAGVRVCIKSDDEELVRHLYLDAAKMMKYGGLTETQALETITLNPARQLGLEHRLGSIDVGKDADIVLFNAHPFDGFARCELALIDGEVWFQRSRSKEPKLAPRPGEHATPPLAAAEARSRAVEVPRNPAGVYAITGATIHPIAGPAIPDGVVVIAQGKIAVIGGPQTTIPTGATTVEARGLDVWPGMIDAESILGLFEVGSLTESQDLADSAPIEPELLASTALHADSELIPVTRANGVLSAFVPPTGGTIAGQGCVIDLDGWVPTEMVVADRVALIINLRASGPQRLESVPGAPEGPPPADNRRQRQERLEAIAAEFRRALAYDDVVRAAKAQKAPAPPLDPRLAALVPYARGEKPVLLRADRRGEILDALKLARDLKLKAILAGGLDAWKVADAIKQAKVPVLVGGTLRLPAEVTDPYDAPYANPARLAEAGITFAIHSCGRGPELATASRNLPYEAAVAVAYGLSEDRALEAVTLAPAKILGVADQLGSLEVGKRANVVITAGHLLQPTTEVKALFIDGKPLAPESRHTRLYAKYRQRLAEVQAGQAPLGIEPAPATASAPGPPPAPPAAPGAANQR